MKLEGQYAIVTGGAGWIGRAIAKRLAAEGAAVAIADVNQELAQGIADEIMAAGAKAVAIEVDICNYDSVQAMAETAVKEFGAIDILVNGAGGSARLVGGGYGPFQESDVKVIDKMIDINLKGSIFCSHAVLGHMVKRGQGKIVNIGSITGVQGAEHSIAYSAAKGGVIAYTKALAKEVGPGGINVNCVSPGVVLRPEEKDRERGIRTNYLGRACKAEDIAELVAFLATDAAGFITGQNYIVDGGRSLGMKTN